MLLHIQFRCDFIIIGRMSRKTSYILFHDEAHLEERCVQYGIIIKNLLLDADCQVIPLIAVESIVQLVDHGIYLGIAVIAIVIRLVGIYLAHEIIFRVPGRCRHDGLGIDVIFAAFQEILIIIGSIDVEFDADIFQGRLGVFREKGEFLTRRIGQPAQCQRLSVFGDLAVTVCFRITRFFQQRFCLFRIVFRTIQPFAIRRRVRECTGCGNAVAI